MSELLDGVQARTVQTRRLRVHVLTCGVDIPDRAEVAGPGANSDDPAPEDPAPDDPPGGPRSVREGYGSGTGPDDLTLAGQGPAPADRDDPGPEGRAAEPVPPLVFIHGNCSSSLFWQPTMLAIGHPSYAFDLRGYGHTETAPVDATRGLRDFSDDVLATMDALGIEKAFLVGWSMGGGVAMQVCIDAPERIAGLTLVAPVSPYGVGGTDRRGRRLTRDGAGTGGGTANPNFVSHLAAKDRGNRAGSSARAVFRSLYVASGYESDHEDLWVTAILSTVTGDDNYPGDSRPSEHWPGYAAGKRGVLNAMSPVHMDLSGIVDVHPQPRILWIHGAADAIVSDASSLDTNLLGRIGVLPGWPGARQAPQQQMVVQTRDVLGRYLARGGPVREIVFPGCGHSPHLERPREFVAALRAHLNGSSAQ